MTSGKTIAGVLLIVGIGLAAYATTLVTRGGLRATPPADDATEALLDWLDAPEATRAELRRRDPGFAEELKQLRTEAAASRTELATALEKGNVPDAVIMADVEKVIAADSALERRVAKYLLTVRDHLTSDQQRRLFCLCAETVRRCANCRYGQAGAPGPMCPRGGACTQPCPEKPKP